ncbi:MAG: F0F1 ATP synthase subunit A [Propionicimonas sp.]|uniref:F0F1 ATP synthase subunit A n=1 Tax=Propionicimonas sp. TaxID=1955623 RepID=UPI002B1EBC47|nr:F0F1 ATP synthase subunit A [Propionicimonas sp.]MEA4943152.1 F0F1 ATP synthase subunit A [Propionicimonas sp.]MEA5053220.1 F0F1 ATP synthase subunit A [Propionicimonas sp.]
MIPLLIPMDSETHAWPPGVHSFDSRPLFPGLGENWVWLNNHLAQAVIGAVLVIGFWLWMAHNQKVVPGKKQFVGEFLYNLLRNSIARDILGHDYRKYLPYLVALFSFILVNNLFGQFFLFMFPTFSKIGFAYGLALCTFLLYNGAGIRKYGFGHYMRKMTLPEGVPWPLWPLIIPLEFISNFVARPITLALRLFANLFAGHLVIMVFVVGGSMLLTMTEPAGRFAVPLLNTAGVVSLLFSFAIFALELLVGTLQAYIFTVLTAQYVSSAIAEEH